jgi:AcrR family transcriptional regulator
VTSERRPYHHGDLRRALLDAAAAEIAEAGVAAMSLRKVAARAGVTHTAAAHHFGDKRGLLTALAVRGHRALAEAMEEARTHGMLALGEAYLRFADGHRAEFEVMFQPDVVRRDDPELVAAAASSFGGLRGTTAARARGRAAADVAYGAWALVHGIAVLWSAGNLPAETLDDVQALFRRAARALSAPPVR